ncbi:MAG TPA: hypothetical protein ENN63_06840 [Bacteroidetes bacterium]|nr:hypothetical protein [Bacteroidota bacterium]
MKRAVFFCVLTCLCTAGVVAQETKKEQKGKEKTQAETGKPQESWNVTREVDEHGNIIRYDSTYVWSYRTGRGDTMRVQIDSLLKSFHFYFGQHFPDIWERSLIDPFRNDSLFHRDFFGEDYFHQRWEEDFFHMDEMFRRMDSLRMRFFREWYPEWIGPPKRKEPAGTKI